jgi:hypothetical protein
MNEVTYKNAYFRSKKEYFPLKHLIDNACILINKNAELILKVYLIRLREQIEREA